MGKFNNKTVWITGASSGIGEAVAYRLAQEGARLILTSRTREALESVAGKCKLSGAPEVRILPYDLSDTGNLDNLADTAWQMFGRIDILFNNAGISQRSLTTETDVSVIHKIMDINFMAPVILTKRILPRMIGQGGGNIAVTSSINGLFGFPLRCAYSSSKHALYGFFETVRAEYHDTGIRVTIVCPGRVRTNISMNAIDANGLPHGKMDSGQAGGISPQKAADKIVNAIYRGKPEVLVGGKELIMVYIKRLFPRLCDLLSRKVSPT